MLFIIVDIAIIAIIAFCILMGYKRGLTQSLIHVLSFVLALIIALVLFKPVSNFVVNNTKIDDKIKDSIVQIFMDEENEKTEEEKDKKEEDTTVAKPIIEYMNKEVEKSTEQVKSNAVDAAATHISIIIVDIGVAIILFIISRFLLIFVKAITNLITKLPIIKQCNKLGGIVFGLLQGLVIVYVILAIITVIVALTGNYALSKLIGESYIGSILYNDNLLL